MRARLTISLPALFSLSFSLSDQMNETPVVKVCVFLQVPHRSFFLTTGKGATVMMHSAPDILLEMPTSFISNRLWVRGTREHRAPFVTSDLCSDKQQIVRATVRRFNDDVGNARVFMSTDITSSSQLIHLHEPLQLSISRLYLRHIY